MNFSDTQTQGDILLCLIVLAVVAFVVWAIRNRHRYDGHRALAIDELPDNPTLTTLANGAPGPGNGYGMLAGGWTVRHNDSPHMDR